jgi:hypothetical protein
MQAAQPMAANLLASYQDPVLFRLDLAPLPLEENKHPEDLN